VEVAAIFLLLGAQVIATHEHRLREAPAPSPDAPPLADATSRV
jgi:hypothetical protein